MGSLVDLTATPYNLSPAQIGWVEETLASLSDEEKVGQLFVNLFHFGADPFSGNDLSNQEILARYHIGGARFHGGSAEQVQTLLNQLQRDAKIPLLIAANCDAGGNGACKDGTYIASAAQVEATRDPQVAYNVGLVSARAQPASAVSFEPKAPTCTPTPPGTGAGAAAPAGPGAAGAAPASTEGRGTSPPPASLA